MKKPTLAERVAARYIRAMAYKRSDFKNKVQGHLVGAIVESYKASLAKKNGQSEWVSHWEGEVDQLLKQLVREILHPIRGFTSRRKAFEEAVVEIQSTDKSYRTYAENTVCKDYGLGKLKYHLDSQDTRAFWDRVDKVVEPALEAHE